jgi:hypothetical protein
VDQSAPSPRFSGEAAGSAVVLAGLLLEAGRPAQALACVEDVMPAYEKVVRTEQDGAKAAEKGRKEGVQLKPGHMDKLQTLLRMRAISPDDSLHRQWAALLACRGAALDRLGRREEAVEAVRQAVGVTEALVCGGGSLPPSGSPASLASFLTMWLLQLEPCYSYDLACHLALASTLSGDAGNLDLPNRAVLALRCAIASGFDNPHQLRTDPALEPLQKRDDFQKLVSDLEARVMGPDVAPRNR